MQTVAQMTRQELVRELVAYGVSGGGLNVMSIKALRLSVEHCRERAARAADEHAHANADTQWRVLNAR